MSEEAPLPPYVDPGEMAGITFGEYVYAGVVIVAAGADLTAFHQVLSLLFRRSSGLIIWMAVAGFTACALLLAHSAGRLQRDLHERYGRATQSYVQWIGLVWASLGLIAFLVRLFVHPPQQGTATVTSSSLFTVAVASAFLFLALYVASGLIAAIGAYFVRQPLRARYRKAELVFRHSRRRASRPHARYERATNVLQMHVRNRRNDDFNYAAALELRKALAAGMREYARLRMAAHLQDPSATTGLTYPPSPRPPSER